MQAGAVFFDRMSTMTLRELAQQAGMRVGCHPDFAPLQPDPGQTALIQREFDTAVFNVFHWSYIEEAGPGEADWSAADAAAQWARAHGLRLRGHCLLWYQMLPSWFAGCGTASEAERHLRRHITSIVSRYRGVVQSWDVVNEAVWVADGAADGLRRDVLHGIFGERYLDIAFDAARAADPEAELVLNEALLTHRDQARQRDAFRGLLSRLLERGAPVDAGGIQSHLYWDDKLPMGPLDPEATAELADDLGSFGLGVLLTELDVFDTSFPADPRERDRRVAAAYREFLSVVMAGKNVGEVIFWGLGDMRSWYNTYVRRVLPDRLPAEDWVCRPLLFDGDYRPKPAYLAVAESLKAFQHAGRAARALAGAAS